MEKLDRAVGFQEEASIPKNEKKSPHFAHQLRKHYILYVYICVTYMREEESPGGVVWISGRLAVLVVRSVIPGPRVDGVLRGHAVGKHQEKPERGSGLIGTVCPKAVGTGRHALGAKEK